MALVHSDRLSAACLLFILAIALSISQVFLRLDYVLFDVGQKLFAKQAPSDVIIVAVDEYSLSQLGRWPWSRQQHAKLIERLHADGAKVIGLDVVLSEPELNNSDADKQLALAIQKAQNVVLPVLVEGSRVNGQLIETLPLPILSEHAAALGRVHVVLDDDGLARGIYLREGLGDLAWPHFTQAMLQTAQQLPIQYSIQPPTLMPSGTSQPYALQRADYRKINFLGAPGHFQHLSYAQVVNGEFAQGTFKDKIVLIGATAVGLGDSLPMPMTGLKQAMSGVEFHANVLEAMRSNRLIKVVPLWLTCMACLGISLLPLVYLPKTTATRGLLATAVLFLITLGLAVSLPSLFNIWLPLTPALVALICTYPIWSWRKLEAASLFLDKELALLQQDLSMLGVQQIQEISATTDVFQTRIQSVQQAAQSLRNLHQHKAEMLAFISHDIRAPLATLLLKIETEAAQDSFATHLKKPLARALDLVEKFLQSSRAEMLSAGQYQPLDLADLLHQVIDDAYAIAKDKQISLVRELETEETLVNGEFGLLHRAILNLVLNAIKFSSQGSQVILRLTQHHQQALVEVIDHGAGISPEMIANLFTRFKKGEGAGVAQTGAGLGLYFVKTVVEKHLGSISVESTPQIQTTFKVCLPLHQLPT